MRWRIWLRRALIALVIAIPLIALAVVMVIRSDWAREKVRGLAESQAAKYLDGELRVGRVSGSLLQGVTLEDVRFTRSGTTAFSAARVEVQYDAWSLIRGGREISFIRLIEPYVLVTEKDGRWNVTEWARSRPPSTGEPAAPFVLAHIELVNGHIQTSAVESAWQLPPDLSAVNGMFRLRIGGPTEVTVDRLAFQAAGVPNAAPLTVGNIAGTITLGPERLFAGMRVDSNAGDLTLDGRVGPFSDGADTPLSMEVALDGFDTRAWRAFSPMLDKIALSATGPATIGGTLSDTAIRARLTSSAGAVTTETRIQSRDRVTHITGTADLANFDAQSVTAEPSWASSVTGHVTYDVTGTGSPAEWQATATVDGGPVRAFDVAAERVQGRVNYTGDAMTFDATASAYGGQAHAAGTLTLEPALAMHVEGDSVQGIDPRRLPAAWEVPQVDASLNASAFAADWREGQWRASATLEESAVEGGTIASGTTVSLESRPGAVAFAADGAVRNIDARRLGVALEIAALDDERFTSTLNGNVHVTGSGEAWATADLTGRAELVDTRVAGATLPTAAVSFQRRGHVVDAKMTSGIVGLDPAKAGAPESVTGELNGSADVSVTYRDDVEDPAEALEAQGTVRLTPSTLMDQPIDRGVVSGEWRGGAFIAQTLDLTGRGLHVTGRGRIAVTSGESNATFEATAADLTSLEPLLGRALEGAVRAQGQLRGTFEQPRLTVSAESDRIASAEIGELTSVSANADVVFPEWDLNAATGAVHAQAATYRSGERVVREIAADGRIDSGAFEGKALARYEEYGAEISARATWTDPWHAEVTDFAVTHGNERWARDPASGVLRVSATGVTAENVRVVNGASFVALDGQVQLRDGDPAGRLTFEARQLHVMDYVVDRLSGLIDVENGAMRVNIPLTQPRGTLLTAKGVVPLAAVTPDGFLKPGVPTPDWNLTLVTDPLDLDMLDGLVPRVQSLVGQFIVDLRVVGAPKAPSVTGTVALADAGFEVPTAGVAFSNIIADIGLDRDQLTVRRFVAEDENGHALTITGRLGVAERSMGAFTVNVEADRVLVLDNEVGNAEVSALLTMTGDLKHPLLAGNVEVTDGRVEVDRLLRLLQGDPTALVAEANLPAEGDTSVDLREQADQAAEAAAKAPPPTFDSTSFLQNLAVDVRLLAPDNLVLRGNNIKPGRNGWSIGDMNVTVGGQLNATRRNGETRLRGDITTIRGAYSFQGRRFEIQRGGRIQFDGEDPIDPTFDIRAVRTVQGIEARVDVSGRLSDPNLQLGSNVPLDDADILSLIIFNRPANQLGQGEQASLVGAAASLAGGFVATPLSQSLSRALNLDLLEVETVSYGQNVAPRIRVGQQIGNRLFVQYSQLFGPQSLGELTAEYQLTPYMRLHANTTQGAGSRAQRTLLQRVERFGVDLIFFFNY